MDAAKRLIRPFITLIFASFALGACSSTPLSPRQLADAVAYDAAAYNEASAKAANAEMLLNILRSRDRWPWRFSTVSGINATRQNQLQLSAGWTLPWDGLWKGQLQLPT